MRRRKRLFKKLLHRLFYIRDFGSQLLFFEEIQKTKRYKKIFGYEIV